MKPTSTHHPAAFRKGSAARRRLAWALVAAPLFLAVRAPAVVPWTILINTTNIVNVTNYGAVGDGVVTNTLAISNAINAAAAGPRSMA